MTRAAVIYNPSAGRGRGGAIAAAVQGGLTKRGLDVEAYATSRPKDAMAIARRLACVADIVVAIGGDGTINEIANGLAAPTPPDGGPGCKAVLGIVPAGTVNVLALELGLPFQVERACNVIAGGKTISLDLGNVNGRGFLLMMGAGVDALTVRHIDPLAKRRFKELAFLTTGVKQGFAARPPAFTVRVDGKEYRSTFFVAGNSRYYAGRLGMTPDADPTDGVLDMVVFTGTTRSSLAVFWLGVPSGLHLRNSNVIYLRAQRAELLPIDTQEVTWYQTDGELAGRLPAIVKIDPQALQVLVP